MKLKPTEEELPSWYFKDFNPEKSVSLFEKQNIVEDNENEMLHNGAEYMEEDKLLEDIYGDARNYNDDVAREEISGEDYHAARGDETVSREDDEDIEVHIPEKCHEKSNDSSSIIEQPRMRYYLMCNKQQKEIQDLKSTIAKNQVIILVYYVDFKIY